METLTEVTPVALKITMGVTVKVVGSRGKGEKAPKGTLGRVFWIGQNEYSYYGHESTVTRVGFETAEGKSFFTAASNLQVQP